MREQDPAQRAGFLTSHSPVDFKPVLESAVTADDTAMKQYLKALRRYFVSGKKTSQSLPADLWPAVLTPFLKRADMHFPVLYDENAGEIRSLKQFLERVFAEVFANDEAVILGQSLDDIVDLIRADLQDPNPNYDYTFLINAAFKELRQRDLPEDIKPVFDEHCNTFEAQLLYHKVWLIDHAGLSAFALLNLGLKKQKQRNREFLGLLQKAITGLNDLLFLQSKDMDSPALKRRYDFAGDMIAFDKVAEMAIPATSSGLPETRVKRVRECLQTLENAHASYLRKSNVVMTTTTLAEKYALKETLTEAGLMLVPGEPVRKLRSLLKREVRGFVRTMAALKRAELEIDQKYVEDLHNPFFEAFDLAHLSASDLQYFRALILIEESKKLMDRPDDFLYMISGSAPAKICAVTSLEELNMHHSPDEGESSFLELAALAIFRRKAYIFQGAADTPDLLQQAIDSGLQSLAPALWNILVSPSDQTREKMSHGHLKAAIESRFFPRVVYDQQSGDDFGSHFDIASNPEPAEPFPSIYLETETNRGTKALPFRLTIADFLALEPANRKQLEIIPGEYHHEDQIELAIYLEQPVEAVAGKIPYIWLADAESRLQRAAVPVSWLKHCRSALEYWDFIQELGGVHSSHIRNALETAQAEFAADKEVEIAELKASIEQEIERIRTEEVGQAINRMLHALLGSEQGMVDLLSSMSQDQSVSVSSGVTAPKLKSEAGSAEPHEDPRSSIRDEVWVESDACTSCKDCIDALPGVFKYNSDKQAVVHNPKAGTYAKIVSIAEKCPARCIHPGLPHNPDEPGLEKLMKRAEKYN